MPWSYHNDHSGPCDGSSGARNRDRLWAGATIRGVPTVPVLDPVHYWECPSCGFQHVTKTVAITSELHLCPKKAGLMVPLVEVDEYGLKERLHHRVIERGDYIGSEIGVRHDANRQAVMAVHTERSDGSHDTHVYAPIAQGHARRGEE